MVKIKYILFNFFKLFLISSLCLLSLFFIIQILEDLPDIISGSQKFLLSNYILTLPSSFVLISPLITLLSGMFFVSEMVKANEIKIFEDKKVRTLWDGEHEKWYFSIIDVIEILTGSPRPRKYWNALKTKLKAEGSELSHKLGQLKMQSADGKFYLTDVADTEQLFRLIQSIPSPKAEPFKLWLAQVASERLDEMQDPELSIDRALEQYMKLGYSENWINQRLKSIEIRKELTDEWKKRGLKEGVQFATLTDIITKAWSDKTTKEYKILKGLKKENLRDNMTNTELILNMLAEASTKDISAATNPKDFEESKKVAKQGGNVAKVARKELEAKTGKNVVTALNAKILSESGLKKLKDKQDKKKKSE